MTLPTDEQLRLLSQDAAEVVPSDELERKLQTGRPLRVKLGVDPTADQVTLGWAVPLWKLRQFQDLGHTAVLIVGDFTARIGDPSEQDRTRPMLSAEEVDQHAERVLGQFRLILKDDSLEIRKNSEWLEAMGVPDLLELSSHYTVAQMLGRDDFSERYRAGAPITLREFLYPLLQGYDSIAVRADVELGGTDQHFNLIVGRHLQRAYGQEPQVVLTMPLLEGTDGVRKMSQSLGNYVGIAEDPEEMFGKIMSIPDSVMDRYMRLAANLDDERIAAIEREHPRPETRKRMLASEIVRLYHGIEAASEAMQRFDAIFVDGRMPADVPQIEIPVSSVNGSTVYFPRLLADIGFAPSSTSARRLISQGGVYLEGERISADEMEISDVRGRVLAVGKRRFARLV